MTVLRTPPNALKLTANKNRLTDWGDYEHMPGHTTSEK